MPEIDLHHHTADEALRAFVAFYNREFRKGSREPIRVIHGYGSSGEGGVIRRKLRTFLETCSASLEWKPGEDIENNPGFSMVYPRRSLPDVDVQLAAAILAFCVTPRTESKIAGEFRKYGQSAVKEAIRGLLKQGRLKESYKGGHRLFGPTGA